MNICAQLGRLSGRASSVALGKGQFGICWATGPVGFEMRGQLGKRPSVCFGFGDGPTRAPSAPRAQGARGGHSVAILYQMESNFELRVIANGRH